jgi:hypothetical protein
MMQIKKEEAGWLVAVTWLSALEEAARDFHGTHPKVFCERVSEHSVQHYLQRLGDEYGIRIEKSGSIREAVEQYIQIGLRSGLFDALGEFDLESPNPNRLELTVHNCEYLKSCETLIHEGFTIKNLTCARIGCFRAAVKAIASIDCDYQVRSFNLDGDCHGFIERV